MATGGGDNVLDQATWRAFLAAKYFAIPEGKCSTCTNEKFKCGVFFCVECKVGGVCEATFQEGGDHAHHPHLRVWRVTLAHAVLVDDLKKFMSAALVDHIQLYAQNGSLHCKFFGRNTSAQSPSVKLSSKLQMCHGCGLSIPATTNPSLSPSPVCSLQCLLDCAAHQRRAGRRQRRKQNSESICRVAREAEYSSTDEVDGQAEFSVGAQNLSDD